MDQIEEVVRLNNLYDLYKNLLTEKQREYFEAFYQDNMSLKEIAENYDVSRNAVYSQLNLTKESLTQYENKLGLFMKEEKRSKIIEEIKKKSNDDEISKLLDKLEEV